MWRLVAGAKQAEVLSLTVIAFILLLRCSKQIQHAVCASYEIWVVCVDMCILNFNQISDHFSRWGQAFVQHAFHHITDFALKFVVSLQLWNFDADDNLPKLFVDLIGAIERWLQESSNLLSNQNFECSFRHKQTWAERRSILNSRLNILFTEILKWIYAIDYFVEDLMENIIDSGTTLALNRNFLDELTLNLITIRVQERVDQIQNHRSLVRVFNVLTLS